MRKFVVFLVIASFIIISFHVYAELKTAVTISVEAGPAYTEGNVETVDLVVPDRPNEASSLQVGDKVFFAVVNPNLEGEGTITAVYDVNEAEIVGNEIKEAVFIDHVFHE